MRALINLKKGFKATGRTARMVLLLFLVNVVTSLILAVPMYHTLKDSFGRSQVGERMAEGFDYLWWEEFRDENRGLAETFSPSIIGKGALLNNLEGLVQMRFFSLPPAVLALALIYLILHTFLAGGVLSIFKLQEPRFSMRAFFEGAGQYFFRFLLLMILSWMFFILIGSAVKGGLDSILQDVARNALTEKTPFYLGLLSSALTLFLLLFIQMVFDYARIITVLEEQKNMSVSTLKGFGFIFRHLASSLGLFWSMFIISVAAAVFYVLLREAIPQSALWGVLSAFILQQVYILAVVWLRCWLYAGQMSLYRYFP